MGSRSCRSPGPRGDSREQRRRSTDLVPLVVEQPERLVPTVVDSRDLHRTTQHHSPLVLTKRGLAGTARIPEEVVGVELVVAEELEERTVKFIGSRLEGHGDVCPGTGAEFRRRDIRLHPEFPDGVDGRLSAECLEEQIVILNAVQREVVDVRAVAADAEVVPA